MENEAIAIPCIGGIGNLPDVFLLKIFGYLEIDDLCRAGRVCDRWHTLSRSESFWKSVDVQHIQLTSKQIGKLFRILPEITKSLRVYSTSFEIEVPQLDFLRNQCPHLQTLILDNVVLTTPESLGNLGIWNLPYRLSVFSVRNCRLDPFTFFNYDKDACSSHQFDCTMAVLDCTRCRNLKDHNILNFRLYRLYFLQELYLPGCPISDVGIHLISGLKAISGLKVLDLEMTDVSGQCLKILSESCKFLKQLFISSPWVTEAHIKSVQIGWFPNLDTICLKGTKTRWAARRSLISKLPKLQFMNGFPCTRVLSENLMNDYDYLSICDHFSLRLRDIKLAYANVEETEFEA